jgi:hypothetical protein
LDTIPGTVTTITAIVLILAALHGTEAWIWAVVYLRLGLLSTMADALLYSLGAMSTAGSGLSVHMPWRFMGAIESFDGLLLFGISTAFVFSLMRLLWGSDSIHRGPARR